MPGLLPKSPTAINAGMAEGLNSGDQLIFAFDEDVSLILPANSFRPTNVTVTDTKLNMTVLDDIFTWSFRPWRNYSGV